MPEARITAPEARDHSLTVREALLKALAKTAAYNQNHQVPPVAVIWPDKEKQWLPLAPLLRASLPHFLTLGDYNPEHRIGPAIWIKCMLAHTLPEAEWPETTVPILYLPGVSRQDLRAIDSCPKPLQPLAELQYRGIFWSQQNGRDWTVFAFLKSKDGLGLDVAQDHNTLNAMLGALYQLADIQITELQGRRLEADDFHALLNPDPVRSLLQWLNDPQGCQSQWDPNQWNSFCSICKTSYAFDPQKDGEIVAGEKLGNHPSNWSTVWDRFAEAPNRYPGIPELLRRSKPDAPDIFTLSSWPQENETQEETLRKALTQLGNTPQSQAIQQIRQLESQHGQRREWIWAALGQSPLANALQHLITLAQGVETNLGGSTPTDMAEQYTSQGWRADAAVLQALASVERSQDTAAVTCGIRSLYLPWLENAAHHLQSLVQTQQYPPTSPPHLPQDGECILFADGLRFDLGQILLEEMNQRSWQVDPQWQWVALPPVTATSKPAISPIAETLQGSASSQDFRPEIRASGKPLTPDRFTSLMTEHGIQVLSKAETGDPKGKAWTEFGDIDHYGHQHGAQLAQQILSQLRTLLNRIEALLEAGWTRVHVITDHGWLLMPGGLPKFTFPKFLAETYWGRCAILRETSITEAITIPWHWSSDITLALTPGIGCCKAGTEYAHGSISLQECITPSFSISLGIPTSTAILEDIQWIGLRCRITVNDPVEGLQADIRRKPADPTTSLANGGKAVSLQGKVSLAIEDDSTEGESAIVVLLDAQGTVIHKQATIIGGE